MAGMNHRQKAAMLGLYLAHKRGETINVRKVTADALISRGYARQCASKPTHFELTEAGLAWFDQYEFSA